MRACYAALRMQESVKRRADGVFRSHGVPVQIRVGLNAREVVGRSIRFDARDEPRAIREKVRGKLLAVDRAL